MAAKNLCYGKNSIETPPEGLSKMANQVHWHTAREDNRAQAALGIGGKRLRLLCPECGRRLIASVYVCDDGCCFYQYIPPHKPKGWWKKGVKKSSKNGRKRV